MLPMCGEKEPHEVEDNVALKGYAKLLAASLDDAPHTLIDSAPYLQRSSGKLVPMRTALSRRAEKQPPNLDGASGVRL